MSMTFNQMIDETQQQLRSFVRDQELTTWLTFDLADDGLSFTVNDASVVSRGRIEIDDELLIVEGVEAADNKVRIPPFGRGADGTTPAAHTANSKLTVQPLYPRKAVADTLNQVIRSVGSKLFGIRIVELKAHPTRVSYELPEDTNRVLSVSFRYDKTATKDVVYARDWSFDQAAEWPSGKGILLYDYPKPGDPISVVTAVEPVPLAPGDDFSDSLLLESAWDVITLGAVSRLIATAGAYIINTRSIGAQTTQGDGIDASASLQMGRYFYQQHEQRLEEEVSKLLGKYVSRVHYQRWR